MRSVRAVGLCLFAGFVLACVGASTAAAAEVGECVKAPKSPITKKHTGVYSENSCQTLSEKPHMGKYEWSSGVAPSNAGLTVKAGGTVRFQTLTLTITCKLGSSAGEWASNKRGLESVTLESCRNETGPGTGPCQNPAAAEGTIVSNPLEAVLRGEGEELPAGESEPFTVPPGEVFAEITALGGSGTLYEIECRVGTSVDLKIQGDLGARLSPVDNATKFEALSFEVQGLSAEASVGGGPFEGHSPVTEQGELREHNATKLVFSSIEK